MIIRLDYLGEILKRISSEEDTFHTLRYAPVSLPLVNAEGVRCTAFRVLEVRQASATVVIGPMDHLSQNWSIVSEFSGSPPSVGSVLFCDLETGLCEVRSAVNAIVPQLLAYSKKLRKPGITT